MTIYLEDYTMPSLTERQFLGQVLHVPLRDRAYIGVQKFDRPIAGLVDYTTSLEEATVF